MNSLLLVIVFFAIWFDEGSGFVPPVLRCPNYCHRPSLNTCFRTAVYSEESQSLTPEADQNASPIDTSITIDADTLKIIDTSLLATHKSLIITPYLLTYSTISTLFASFLYFRKVLLSTSTSPALDSFYFIMTTLSNVGFGDVLPLNISLNPTSRFLTTLISSIGVVLTGMFSAYVVGGRLSSSVNGPSSSTTSDASKEAAKPLSKRRILNLTVLALSLLCCTFSALMYTLERRWTLKESIYFTLTTLNTLGMGDITPTTPFTKLLTGFFSITGSLIFGGFVGLLATIPVEMREKKLKVEMLQKLPDELDEETFEYLASSERVKKLGLSANDSYCTRDEFTLLMLVELGVVTEEDLDMCRRKFEKLDVDRSGSITKMDLYLVKGKTVARELVRGIFSGPWRRLRGRTDRGTITIEAQNDDIGVDEDEDEDEIKDSMTFEI
ncbi:hypothetical protein TrVE_jg5744 [Triparma verrucosa]|uniref:Potassium channel domain-containing protein n=1 Tax=Triparma verrucosa TaxID=1606542 RepID=A0A9W6Z725_9STRA|nr:hypothetical protein TrVE_jg5744 [Triparma verrucosa]